MFIQRLNKLLLAAVLILPMILMSNISTAADSSSLIQATNAAFSIVENSNIYSGFTTQNAAAESDQWAIVIALLVGFGIAVLFWTRPKDFSSKTEFQNYYEKYRTRAI